MAIDAEIIQHWGIAKKSRHINEPRAVGPLRDVEASDKRFARPRVLILISEIKDLFNPYLVFYEQPSTAWSFPSFSMAQSRTL